MKSCIYVLFFFTHVPTRPSSFQTVSLGNALKYTFVIDTFHTSRISIISASTQTSSPNFKKMMPSLVDVLQKQINNDPFQAHLQHKSRQVYNTFKHAKNFVIFSRSTSRSTKSTFSATSQKLVRQHAKRNVLCYLHVSIAIFRWFFLVPTQCFFR